jgi:hypothetical protein
MKSMDECVEFLCESDQMFADAKAKVKYLEKKLKVIKARAFLDASGTGEVRKAESEVAQTHLDALEEYRNAVLDMETLGVERETINIRIEIWRTKSANTRKGNI